MDCSLSSLLCADGDVGYVTGLFLSEVHWDVSRHYTFVILDRVC